MPLLCEVQQHSVAVDQGRMVHPHFWQYMTVRGLLLAAVRGAELPVDLDSPFLAEALLAPLSAPLVRFQREELGFSVERISNGMQTMVNCLGGL